jgi:predicted amidohydrolase
MLMGLKINRRTLGVSAITAIAATQAAAKDEKPDPIAIRAARAELPPRKTLIATSMQGYYGPYPGLTQRLSELAALVEEMAAKAASQHPGKRLDLIVLPEDAVTTGRNPKAQSRAVPYEGEVEATFAPLAKKYGAYLMVPLDLLESGGCANAVVLLDRKGQVAGTYRKVHPVCALGRTELEGGISPGREFPVFDCDFGRLGIQICYDIVYPDGWAALGAKGADLVAWPSASPATIQPASRARENGYYLVSSTYRHNASLIEPTGVIRAQIKEPTRVMVQEIDLSYMLLQWSGQLENGNAFKERYGDRAGFRYYEGEDIGVFWSNDPSTPIGKMARELGLMEVTADVERSRNLQDRVRGGSPKAS